MTQRARRRGLLAGLALAVCARTARAGDTFEIQVYDGTADAPGQAGLEAHLNHTAVAHAVPAPPELPADGQTHLTLEPSYGILPTWELGAYFMTALRGDGTFDVVGGKLRSKHVAPPGALGRARLGVNLEVSYARAAYDPERWAIEVRPIAAWEDTHVLLAVNPIVGVSLRDGSAAFEPAAMALFQVPGVMSMGLEYYGDLAERAHYLYEVANLLRYPSLELNVGVGEGLTTASNDLVVKAIIGHAF